MAALTILTVVAFAGVASGLVRRHPFPVPVRRRSRTTVETASPASTRSAGPRSVGPTPAVPTPVGLTPVGPTLVGRVPAGLARPVLAAVVLAAAGAALWFPWGASAALMVPVLRRARAARRRRRRDEVWADGIDALVVLVDLALQGGVSLRRALGDVLPWLPPEIGDVLAHGLGRAERGTALADELDVLATGPIPQLAGLARVVAATERYGAPALPGLEVLAAERRFDRSRRLERAARQVPVHLLLPLVGGVLPAFVLLSVVPMLAGALGNLRTLAGR